MIRLMFQNGVLVHEPFKPIFRTPIIISKKRKKRDSRSVVKIN